MACCHHYQASSSSFFLLTSGQLLTTTLEFYTCNRNSFFSYCKASVLQTDNMKYCIPPSLQYWQANDIYTLAVQSFISNIGFGICSILVLRYNDVNESDQKNQHIACRIVLWTLEDCCVYSVNRCRCQGVQLRGKASERLVKVSIRAL